MALWQQAVQNFESSLKLNPKDSDATFNHDLVKKKLEELKEPRPEWVKLLHEFSPITHVSAGDPPVLISNPRVDPLPATTPPCGSSKRHGAPSSEGRKL